MGSKLKSILSGLLLGSSICLGSFGGYFAYNQYLKLQNQESKLEELERDKNNEREKLEDLVKTQKKLEKEFEQSTTRLEQILGDDDRYDNNNVLVQDKYGLEKIQDSVCRIKVEATYKNEKTGFMHTQTKIGSGTVIFDDYVLTANHVIHVSPKYHENQFTSRGLTRIDYTLEEIKYTISNKLGKTAISNKVIYSDLKTDSAILKLPKDSDFYSFPFKMGNSLQLKPGNFIYSLGYSADKGLSVKEGIISKSKGSFFLINPFNSYMVSSGINPGDSGGPIVAIRDGEYELVGIAHAKLNGIKIEKMGESVGISQIIYLFSLKYEQNPLNDIYKRFNEK